MNQNPIAIARKLDDGTTQLQRFEYNSLGRVTRAIDPLGRSTSYVYDANGIDLLDIKQTTGTSNELLRTFRKTVGGATSYNVQRRPLKTVDATGHDITPKDWQFHLEFADRHLRKRAEG